MSPKFDSRTIFFHWLSAALVLILWVAGQCIDLFPKGTPRVTVRSLHIVFGILLAVTVVARIIWRRTGGTHLPPADSGPMGKVAIGVHHLLYLLLVATVSMGATSYWLRADTLFGLFSLTTFDPANKPLAHDMVELHGLLANALFLLAGFHAAAALWHHWRLKDDVLQRMLPKS